jgi:N-acetylmuramoyl-L-alanine amidase
MNKNYFGTALPLLLLTIFMYAGTAFSLLGQETDNAYRLKTVIIDAGHGGKDPGSLGKRTSEKEVVLEIALRAGKYIEENIPGVKVIYTRTKDEFVPLHRRAEIANNNKADLFISIHANGNENAAVSGTESLVLGLHRANENFEVAKQENAVILLEDDYHAKYEGFDPNSPESYIIFSLMQNLYFEQSINFAGLVQEQFRERVQRKDRGVKQQGLLVLARTAMPGILVETGFITNADEETYLMSDEGRDYLASAIYRAFKSYKTLVENKASFARSARVKESQADTDLVSVKSDPQITEKGTGSGNTLSAVEFKVQITASSRKLQITTGNFKGLAGVSEYLVGNIYKYAVGSNRTFQEAIAYSKQIKEKFPDAFIIAVKDNKIIPLNQALDETQ